MFNYTELKDDLEGLDDVLVENIRGGGLGVLFAIALYERVTLTSHQESNEYVMQLAEKKGIDVDQDYGISGKIVGKVLDGMFKLFNR
ncbi:hypothetical protein [Methanobacterium sp.]|uniref:hypothetical protein n=1 Tax=Methanobacterium sp. TaxID=2164 RepID=UPI003D652D19